MGHIFFAQTSIPTHSHFPANKNNTIFSRFFFGQQFNNLQQAALLPSLIQYDGASFQINWWAAAGYGELCVWFQPIRTAKYFEWIINDIIDNSPVSRVIHHCAGDILIHEEQQRQRKPQPHTSKHCSPAKLMKRGDSKGKWTSSLKLVPCENLSTTMTIFKILKNFLAGQR